MQTRKTGRKPINLPGRYFTGLGEPVDVILSDVSTGGCRFPVTAGRFAIGAPMQIFVAGSGPHRAAIRWLEGDDIGVSFAVPLEQADIDKFQSVHVPDNAPGSQPGSFEPMPDTLPRRFC